jgi:hypothetical protein
MADTALSSSGTGYDLPAAAIATCANCPQERRRDWADAGLLRKQPPFLTHDVVETAILFALTKRTNKNSAPQAWRAVRQEVRQLAVAGRTDIWIVMTKGGRGYPSEARAVDGAAAAAQVGKDLGGLVWLVHVADAVENARQRFAMLVKQQAEAGAKVTPLAARRGRKRG